MTNNTNYIRTAHKMPDAVRQKISQSLRGRSKSFTHRQKISAGVKNYWSQIPSGKESGTSMNDLI